MYYLGYITPPAKKYTVFDISTKCYSLFIRVQEEQFYHENSSGVVLYPMHIVFRVYSTSEELAAVKWYTGWESENPNTLKSNLFSTKRSFVIDGIDSFVVFPGVLWIRTKIIQNDIIENFTTKIEFKLED